MVGLRGSAQYSSMTLLRHQHQMSIMVSISKGAGTFFYKIFMIYLWYIFRSHASMHTNSYFYSCQTSKNIKSKTNQYIIQTQLKQQHSNLLMQTILKKHVHVIHIKHRLNSLRYLYMKKQMEQLAKLGPQAFAVVISRCDQSPYFIDCLAQHIKYVRKNYHVPVFGFTVKHCTPEAYYLLSVCDQIYTDPMCTFMFRSQQQRMTINGLLQKLNLKAVEYQSQPNLLTSYSDTFKYTGWMQQTNYKRADLDERLFKQSMKNRPLFCTKQQSLSKYASSPKLNFDTLSPVFLGKDMKELGLVDQIGYYPQALKSVFPHSNVRGIKGEGQKIAISTLMLLITSPILLLLFMGKVVVKWTLIFYAWIKARGKKSIKELQQEYEATYNPPSVKPVNS